MKPRLFFLLKVRGLSTDADFVQIRNENFELMANLRCTPPYDSLSRFFRNPDKLGKVVEIIKQLGYGELIKIEL